MKKRIVSWLLPLSLFLLALGPRLYRIGAVIHGDEIRWIERSINFIYALTHGDWAATFQHHHPGVSATWGYGLTLWVKYLLAGDLEGFQAIHQAGNYDMLSLVPAAALFTALVTSLTVVVAYLLLKRIWGPAIALLAGLFLATDPFYLATSRAVHIDALLTSYMTLSLLFILAYIKGTRGKSYLLASAVFGGLALLAKTPALFLFPFTIMALGVHHFWVEEEKERGERARRWLLNSALWLSVALAVFVALWPALWVKPLETLRQVWEGTAWGAETPHEMGNFFWGRPVADPGWLYYPTQAAFRLTPLTLPLSLASLAIFALLLSGRFKKKGLSAWFFGRWDEMEEAGQRAIDGEMVALIILYILGYGLMVSLGAKKQERYLLPVFPLIDLLAAMGLLTFLAWIASLARHDLRKPRTSALYRTATGAITLLLSLSWLTLAPYYSAYFNPLMGGTKVAPRVLLLGGAEGLDLAAHYLDQKSDASELKIAAWGPSTMKLYFRGRVFPLEWMGWTKVWTLADYVVFHISQVQRQWPNPEVVDFFQKRQPEYVARINGIDYAWVYKTPLLIGGELPQVSRPLEAHLGDQVALLGYDLNAEQLSLGQELQLTLHWQALRSMERKYTVFIRLREATGAIRWTKRVQPFDGFFPTTLWWPGEVVLDRYRLTLPLDLPPGQYDLLVGMRDPETKEPLPVTKGGEGKAIRLGSLTIQGQP